MTGFTGSSVWHMLYSFPPNDFAEIERGYEDFAERWNPILDVFDAEGVRFALEVHPTEIAYDFVTTRRALDAIGNREGFGFNFDPSHFVHQFLDPAAFVEEFADRIYHVHVKDSQPHARRAQLDPRLAPQLRRAEPRLGLRLARPRRRRLRGAPPRAEPHRLRRARCRSSGRTPAWTASGARRRRSRSCAGSTSRPSAFAFDAGVAEERGMTEAPKVGFVTMGAGAARRRRARSASACSATPSWARRTPTRYKKLPT